VQHAQTVRRSIRVTTRSSFYSPYSKNARSWRDKPTNNYRQFPLAVELPAGTVRVEGVKLDTSSLASMTVVDDSMSKEVMEHVPDQPIEELRTPLRWNNYECGCYFEENDLFPRPVHQLNCSCVFDWERNKTGKHLVASFNQGLLKMGYDRTADNNEYEDMEHDGLLVPMLFVSITMNIRVIDSYHMPCIVKGIEKLTKKVKNLQQQMNEHQNAPGGVPTGMLKCQSQYLDQFVHLAAMCFYVSRHMMLMSKDNVKENKGPEFQGQFDAFMQEQDWKDHVDIPPHCTHEEESGEPRYHDDEEGLNVVEYLDAVLLDKVSSSMRDVAEDFNRVPAKVNSMAMREACEWWEGEGGGVDMYQIFLLGMRIMDRNGEIRDASGS
jgi:hypothetical protein